MFLGLRPFWATAIARGVVVRRQGVIEEAWLPRLSRCLVQQRAWYRRYTPEETQEVLRLVNRHGKNWTYIGSLLNRTSMSVRQVYERTEFPTYYRQWTPDELEKLKTLVLTHGDDWNTIRANMPYDRPVNVLKTKWREKVNPDIQKGRFTHEETTRLKQSVTMFGYDWHKIALHVQHRTVKQCKHAWKVLGQISQQSGTRYERFTPEEDQALLEAVQKHGADDFNVVRDAMKSTRWPSVLRTRYIDYLDPAIDRSPWTAEEEKRVYELYQQFGKRAFDVKKYFGSKRSRRDIVAHCRMYEKKKENDT